MVMIVLVIAILIVGAMVNWMQHDSTTAVKSQKSTTAINFAEAGIDRAMWKLQGTTTTWATAESGAIIAGYHFDTTYTDIPGGSYRIKISSAGNHRVTIVGEGRDSASKEIRAVSALYKNQTVYSAMMAGANITWAKGLGVYWGPIMSQGNIQLMDDYVAALYFPRKYAKGTVTGTATHPRDTNGLVPPNTDNVEWWTEYDGVPNLPLLDFVALRSSAAATGTLNVYGCKNSSPVGAWDARTSCPSAGSHSTHFGNPWNHAKSARFNPNTDYVWYWDGDVTLSGQWCGSSPCGQSTGLRGTFIVRGNLTVDTPGEYSYTGSVPAKAWEEQNKLTQSTFDSGASGEYPADTGMHQSASTFRFGTDTWCQPNGGGCGWYSTVGLKGFVYVGGNLDIQQFMDFNGAVWVNGTVSATGGTNTSFCGIFYDDTLSVPALNVILLRISWQEIAPSAAAWP